MQNINPLVHISKLFKIMKCIAILTIIGVTCVHANILGQKVTLSLKNVTVKQALKEIEKQCDFVFMYDYTKVDVDKTVNIQAKNETVEQILGIITQETDSWYEIIDRQIVLIPKQKALDNESGRVRQGITVTGIVTDYDNEPLPGVNVVVKGTTVGVVTDITGRFSINVPNTEAVLQFSFVGYVTQEILVGRQNVINVSLHEDMKELEEVVVVGYGVQRKSDLTGSISVTTEEDLLARPQFNALDGLRGKAAEVNILASTGNPLGMNGAAPRVVIRGINSLYTDFAPLFVVDGVQMSDFHFVNPNDIERIEVLKDASATAIYGARGANGVILVTTKRGNVGEGRTVVSYNGYVSLGKIAKKVELMNAAEFVEMEDIAFANLSKYQTGRQTLTNRGYVDGSGNFLQWKPRRTDPLFFDSNGNPLYDTDWQDAVTRNAISYSNQLNVQHQSQKASVGAFLNYTDQQGIMLNNYAKRVNAKMTYDAKPKKWLDINTNIMVNYMWGNTIDDTGGGARRNMWEMPPIIPVNFPDGRWGVSNYATQLDYNLEGMANPVQELETAIRKRIRTKVFGNMAFVFHLFDGLDLRTQLGIDYNQSTSRNYFPTDLLYISSPQGRASLGYGSSLYWQEETYLTYNKVLKGIHRINATLGMSWSEFKPFNFDTGNVAGFTTNEYEYNNLGAGTVPSAPTSSASRWAINSYFGRASYTLMDKYLATATLRVDGSSRFGADNKYGFFPSAGLGWIISNEDFMDNMNWLDNLKLHASYGRTGNTEIELYRSLAVMEATTALINGVRAPTSQIGRMANPALEWEKTDQFDIGVNLSLFRRIQVELDYYHKNTHDLLLERPVPFETGFTNLFMNMGRVDNSGIDLLIQSTNIQTNDFVWETTFNFNHNKNEVKKLGENNEDIIISTGNGNIIHRIGEPLGSFYSKKRLGTWSTAETDGYDGRPAPGESKKTDDIHIIGNGIPRYSGSLINKFYYKNFDLTIDLQFVTGVDVWESYLGAIADRAGVANGMRLMLTDGWREDRQNTMVQQIRHTTLAGQSSSDDSWWVADGSYIRGNLIQLGYTFNKKMLETKGIQDLRIHFSVSNAFLIHSKEFRGYDPEGSANANKWGQNIFFYQYPRERTFTLGASINF